MALIRVPFSPNPEHRRALFERAAAFLSRHGSYEGTPDEGTFHGTTPIGGFAGSYRVIEPAGDLEILLTKKPWLVSVHMIEKEIRRLLAEV